MCTLKTPCANEYKTIRCYSCGIFVELSCILRWFTIASAAIPSFLKTGGCRPSGACMEMRAARRLSCSRAASQAVYLCLPVYLYRHAYGRCALLSGRRKEGSAQCMAALLLGVHWPLACSPCFLGLDQLPRKLLDYLSPAANLFVHGVNV